jgi:hypothetical protein
LRSIGTVEQSFDGTTRNTDPSAQAHHRQRERLAADGPVARCSIHTEEHGRLLDAQERFGKR